MSENGQSSGAGGAPRQGQSARGVRGFIQRLYMGNGGLDIVGKRRRSYIGFGVLLIICILSIILRGFSFGIEFTGGTEIQMPAQGAHGSISVQQVKSAYVDALGQQADTVQRVGSGGAATIEIRTSHLSRQQSATLEATLFDEFRPLGTNGRPSQASISDSVVSGTWGGEISRQALIALVVFLVLVGVFLAICFERWMAVAALLALIHDVVVTAGVYSLVGFEVTPATVIGLLTILGYSLYDTVVVYDKVKENTRGLLSLTRRTYPEAANLALNQTLMRSINTSLIGVLPVIGLLIVGIGLLGIGTLTDLALVLLIGMVVGTASSILLATSFLVDFKMRQQPYRRQAAKVAARRETAAKRKRDAPESARDTDGGGEKSGENRRTSGAAARRAPDVEQNTVAVEDRVPDGADDEPDDELAEDLRRERAMAAAASVPARTGKKANQNRSRSGSKRPSGKKRR